MRILFVDDAADTRDLFCLCFSLAGHTTQIAPDGEMALQIVQQHREILDVVIMDQNMPGLSGLEVARRLQCADGAPIPVILFTGETTDGFEQLASECGVARVLYKPLLPSTVMTEAREIIPRS